MKTWCVGYTTDAGRQVLCACKDGEQPDEAAGMVPTKCGGYVMFPGTSLFGEPTCRACKAPNLEALRLSDTQLAVMKWLGKKWSAQPSHGNVWTINGGSKQQGLTCSTRTLEALERMGLTCKDDSGCWIATEDGRQFAQDRQL